ncbi:acetylajmaline esterase [Ranunculus cassubicifolius]
MATPRLIFCFHFTFFLTSTYLLPSTLATSKKYYCKYNAIYQFGDSISDTGNLVRELPIGPLTPFNFLPYGETYFNKSTGRCSNGKLMIDFIAEALGVPLLEPYLAVKYITNNPNSHCGVNFAVAGATALDTGELLEQKIISPLTGSSLSVQLKWFDNYLSPICSTNCSNEIKRALFMVGETGGNDYNYALFLNQTTEELRPLVPRIVERIINVTESLINRGARRLVVPGNFAIGCLPVYLTFFQSNDSSAYDSDQCLIDLNAFSQYHNEYLQNAIEKLRAKYRGITILYGDYYNAHLTIIRRAPHLGFERGSELQACCGNGGDYNFGLHSFCATPLARTCLDPDRYISWDGLHLTQHAYQNIASSLIKWMKLKHQCIIL